MKIEDYTEIEYYSLAQLEKHFSAPHAQRLYQEILQYRKPYQRMIPGGYYVACNRLLQMVYHCYEELLKKKQHMYDYHSLLAAVIDKVSNGTSETLNGFLECLYSSSLSEAVEHLGAIFGYGIEDTNVYLSQNENPILKICYVMQRYFYSSSSFCFFLVVCILHHHQLLHTLYLFEPKALKSLKMVIEKEDKTRTYFAFLQWLLIQLTQDVVSYPCIGKSEQEIIEHFPFLQQEQAAFYLQHNRPNHYYTIQQYIEANEVCYETGRIKMEQLVKIGWYKKKKVGKKFVYSV